MKPHDQSLEDVALANWRLKDGIRQEGQAEEAARQGREDKRSAVKERLRGGLGRNQTGGFPVSITDLKVRP